jgi:hypothetical protein
MCRFRFFFVWGCLDDKKIGYGKLDLISKKYYFLSVSWVKLN